jgi:integrase
MSVHHLTDVMVRGLKTQGTYFDSGLPAFGMRVGKRRKTWIVVRGRERSRTRLGHYPSVSLADARKQALVLLGSPVEKKTEAPNVGDALDVFYAVHVPTLKPRTQREIKRVLNRHLGKLRARKLDVLEHNELSRITDKLAVSAPSEAWHAFKDMRTFFRWCVPRYIKHSPMEGLKSPTRYVPRKRVLSDEELVAVWRAAETVGYPFGTALQLCVLWGCRWGEVISCRRAFIKGKERVLILPETKNRTEHVLPYGRLTEAALETIPRFNSTDLLFPGKDMEKPWNGAGKAKHELKEICPIAAWKILDLRRTFATKIAERRESYPDVLPHIVEALLNHKLGTLQAAGVITAVAEVYNRYRYLPEKRHAIEEKWEPILCTLLGR